MLEGIRGGVLAYGVSVILIIGAAELGFLLGRRNKDRSDSDARSQISMIEGALLGILGLLLGFTFSMAVNRFEDRRHLVIQEANAMGTVLLRAQVLAPPAYETLKSRMREYVEVRLRYVEAGTDEAKLREALQSGGRLQSELWTIAQEEARVRPTQISALLLASLNDLFDLTEARMAALENSVPSLVWIMLYLVAMLTTCALGFGTGLAGRRILLPITIIPVLLAGLLAMLLDLDRPREGMLQVSQASILRFRDSLK